MALGFCHPIDRRMHDANLLPIRSNKSNLGYSDSLINASFSADGNSSSSKVDYVIYRYSPAIPMTYEKSLAGSGVEAEKSAAGPEIITL